MAKLKCPECGNSKDWENLQHRGGKYFIVCHKCKHKVEGTGGVEVENIVAGGMVVFGFGS